MELDEKQKNEMLKEMFRLVDDIVQEAVDDPVEIAYWEKIFPHLVRTFASYSYSPNEHQSPIYNLFKSIDVLKEDPSSRGRFITYKTEWREFREKRTLK